MILRRLQRSLSETTPIRPAATLSASVACLLLCISCLMVWVVVAMAEPAGGGQVLNADARSPFAVVAEQVMPAVVSITSSKSFTHPDIEGDAPGDDLFRFFPRQRRLPGQQFEMPSSGSGFLVSDEGYVLTNNHVVADATEVEVLLPDETRPRKAEIVGLDPSTDLAVLKIDVRDREISYLRFADSDGVQVGDWAIAIGNPLGELAGSLTVGVISAKGRSDLNIQGGAPRYQDFLQTDAAINFGNSGGPLVDIHGRVIGVNTAINASGQNIGFTIPINLAAHIYEEIRDHGRVVRGYLGVRMRTLSAELAAGRDLAIDEGVLIVEVRPDTPAQRGGVEVGDVIVEFDGQPIREDRDLQFRVADAKVGSKATLRVLRDGAERDLSVTLIEYREEDLLAVSDVPAETGESWLGIRAADVADESNPEVGQLRDAFEVTENAGVIVLGVESGSAAEAARLQAGDVIVEVVNTPIDSLADFMAASELYRDRIKPIALLVRRGEMTSYLTIDPVDQ
jgi:serine protease Do